MSTKTKDYIEPLKSQASEIVDEVSEQAKGLTRSTVKYVSENPWKSVAIVAIAAVTIGYLLGGRED